MWDNLLIVVPRYTLTRELLVPVRVPRYEQILDSAFPISRIHVGSLHYIHGLGLEITTECISRIEGPCR